MTRASLTSSQRTELTGGDVRVQFLVEFDFPGGAVRSCTGNAAVTHDSNTYEPNGLLMAFSGIEEKPGKPPKAMFTMSPVGDMKTQVQAGGYRRRDVNLYLAVLDTDYGLIDAMQMGAFQISTIKKNKTREGFAYEVECLSDLYSIYREHPIYPSNTMQPLRYAGDTYFLTASAIRGQEFEWGGGSFISGPVISLSGAARLYTSIYGSSRNSGLLSQTDILNRQ